MFLLKTWHPFPLFLRIEPPFFLVNYYSPHSVQHDWVERIPSVAPRGACGTDLANYSGSEMGTWPVQNQWDWTLRFLLGGQKWQGWDISWNCRQPSCHLRGALLENGAIIGNTKPRDGKIPTLKNTEALGLDASEAQILLNFSGIWLISYANQ